MTKTEKVLELLQDHLGSIERRLNTLDRSIKAGIQRAHESSSIEPIIAAADELKSLRRERATTNTEALILRNLIEMVKKEVTTDVPF